MVSTMTAQVRRIYVEKKEGFDMEARNLGQDLRDNLGISELEGVRILNRYDVSGLTEEEYLLARNTIFSDPPVDRVYDEQFDFCQEGIDRVFAMEFLPGQYDQRADSASQCLQMMTGKERPLVKAAKLILLQGKISDKAFAAIKNYCINPVESREASLEKPQSLEMDPDLPQEVERIRGFTRMTDEELLDYMEEMGFAMSFEDLKFCRSYFRDEERRDPTVTELRVIDTYWSDHCRHTTFLTRLEDIQFEEGKYTPAIQEAYREYLASRKAVYGDQKKDISLMDIALIGMKEMRKKGMLEDLDESDEINACSIVVNVDVDGRDEEWLVMFKNETHNHPTEIEPFGGAATCLGGAIRDPLSGRSYVYQAMRITGSGDPRRRIDETLPGKLPQRKITTEAAEGYSSYGNQVGVATGLVNEIYDEGFIAKRMELGAVIAAAPKENVVREKPQEGDCIILLGGRTGRDGCGGATGSSKEHTEESILKSGAEVQKGDPPMERKIQRLFRNPQVSRMIKKCNDFGAGGVSVAIGELADGLLIDLDAVPQKYEGLDGTELAISESQERMAVVVRKEDAASFIEYAAEENLEATVVARVTGDRRLRMVWAGKTIVDIHRDFLDTNGVTQLADVRVTEPDQAVNPFRDLPEGIEQKLKDLEKVWRYNLERLNICSQRGLIERFDSTVGAGTVLMPFGGRYQATPAESMVAKIPTLTGETRTGTIMSFGYSPSLSKWSPFHGAVYAIVGAVAKVVAAGGNHQRIRLTLQEYFERLGKDPSRWGKPFSALLGAYYAQMKLGIPAIGGKDSMSGTFMDLDVPPTLVAFAVDVADVSHVISPEFKKGGSPVVYVLLKRDEQDLPDFERLNRSYQAVTRLIQSGRVLAAHTVKGGGLAEAVSKMCFGNRIGFVFQGSIEARSLFTPDYGSLLLEMKGMEGIDELIREEGWQLLGHTWEKAAIAVNGREIDLKEACLAWEAPLEKVFPTKAASVESSVSAVPLHQGKRRTGPIKIAKPRIFMPVFPGTNGEYDAAKAFERAGGLVHTFVIRNMKPADIEASIGEMAKGIDHAQIIMLPGGISGGAEPDGAAKFIVTAFRNPRIRDRLMELLKNRDGLILGIGDGFHALIKLGLVPYGEIVDAREDSPTLTYNTLGRHVSRMVRTRVVSTLSPWLWNAEPGDIHTVAVSHGEGRFVALEKDMERLIRNGQLATQYVDEEGNPSYDIDANPFASFYAVEGISSPDGRVLGKMGHSERMGSYVAVNVPGEKDQKLFESGVSYFG
jgi:phosphoribosylformylglycinamidine synthase